MYFARTTAKLIEIMDRVKTIMLYCIVDSLLSILVEHISEEFLNEDLFLLGRKETGNSLLLQRVKNNTTTLIN
jgi:hypothetical protein